jgi:hypothetical protein
MTDGGGVTKCWGSGVLGCWRASDPVAVAHEGFAGAVGVEAVDVHGGAADHPVDVDEAFVGAELGELGVGHFFAIDEAGGVGLAEGDVAGGVLVKERVPEEDAGLGDGRVVGHEGDFAEAGGAFVGGDELAQGILAGGGGGFGDAAVDKGAADVFDQGAVVGERLGGGDVAVDAGFVRRGEALLGGDVGLAVDAVAGGGASAGPEVVVGKADGEVGGVVGAVEVEGVEAAVVEEVDALLEGCAVGVPGLDGVAGGDAGSGEDGVPQLAEGELGRIVGEDECGPRGCGGGEDGPVDFVAGDELECRLVGAGAGFAGAGDLGGVFGGEQSWVGAGDGEAGGAGFEGSGDAVEVPLGGVIKAGVGSVAVPGEGDFVVGEDGGDELGAGFVGLLGDAADQRESVGGCGEEQLLAVAEVEADADGDFGEAV